MIAKVIEYKSAEKTIYDMNVREAIDKDGIFCAWIGSRHYNTFNGLHRYFFVWALNWVELKNQGVERITGYLVLKGTANSPSFGEHKVHIDFKETTGTASKHIDCIASEVSVTFEYRLTAYYAQKRIMRNFDDEDAKEDSDVTLIVKDQKFHVLKKYLSTHSTYFKSLFSGNFAESGKSEIELKDIDPDDMQNFLELLYAETPIKANSVLGILHLADFFDSKTVIRRCQEFLLEKSNLPLNRKFEEAIKYNLVSEVSVTFEKKVMRNFDDDEAKEDSDVTLIVQGQKFHVLKKYLSVHSTYFKSLFYGNFEESKKSEIELKGIDPDDFKDFLEFIYAETAIKAESVFGILHLADFFHSKTVIRRCDEFLMEPSELPLDRRFEAAVKYNLEKLQDKCISDMKSAADLQSIVPQTSDDYKSNIWNELFIKSPSLIPFECLADYSLFY